MRVLIDDRLYYHCGLLGSIVVSHVVWLTWHWNERRCKIFFKGSEQQELVSDIWSMVSRVNFLFHKNPKLPLLCFYDKCLNNFNYLVISGQKRLKMISTQSGLNWPVIVRIAATQWKSLINDFLSSNSKQFNRSTSQCVSCGVQWALHNLRKNQSMLRISRAVCRRLFSYFRTYLGHLRDTSEWNSTIFHRSHKVGM